MHQGLDIQSNPSNARADIVITSLQDNNSHDDNTNDNIPVDELTENDMCIKLKEHITKKTDKISDKLQYVSLKYDIVKIKFNNYSLTILIVSALITLSDALKLLIIQFIGETNILKIKKENIDFALNIVTLIMGTYMTVIASIIRFQNYREKMEKLKEMQDKLIHMKALYNRELSELRLNKDVDQISIQNKLSEYDTVIDEINIISEITNAEVIEFSKKLSNFRITVTNIKNIENIKLKEIFTT
jgi:uncharacterized integral membrane protein